MTTKAAVENYYNKFWKELDNKGLTVPNSRHFIIIDKMKKNGLRKDSKVLEIGCGIGTLSKLTAEFCKDGNITAVDISPETIELAKYKFQNQKNLIFQVSDMSNWSSNEKFNFIILPDVLEHIPIDQHKNLFYNISKVCNPKTKIFINIPHPKALEYFHLNKKEQLQIIDQPIPTNTLSESVYSINFFIDSIESYSIDFQQADYQFIILKNGIANEEFIIRPKLPRFIQFWKYRIRSWF